MRKVWDVIFTVVVVFILIQVAVVAIQPYLPLLGISLVVILIGLAVRTLYFRRKFW